MEIVIEGHKIDTKDIWDVIYEGNSRGVWVTIKLIDKPEIIIGRKIPYETYQYEMHEKFKPYIKLYDKIKEKWNADKSELPVFKL